MKPYLLTAAFLLAMTFGAWVGILPGTNAPTPGLGTNVIVAPDPIGPEGVPVEQMFITNPDKVSTWAQLTIGFGVWDGSAYSRCGWVGVTAAQFSFAPNPLSTYLENDCAGGIEILADDPTGGKIAFYTGGYTSDAYKRMLITPIGQVVVEMTDGSTQGLAIQTTSHNSDTTKSLANLNFYDSTTLDSQIINTNSNYSNAGVNIAPSSLGLINEASGGYVYVAAAGTGGLIAFNTGGYGAANTRAVIPPDGGLQIANASLPTCNAAHRGTIFYQAGGSGVADVREMCMKAANDSYSWVTF